MHLIKYQPLIQYLTGLQNLKMLDLSSNKIKTLLPPGVSTGALTSLKLSSLLSLNISDNPIKDLKNTADYIACIMPEVTDL
jgi:Leucine-rich repeat (LRR) protein